METGSPPTYLSRYIICGMCDTRKAEWTCKDDNGKVWLLCDDWAAVIEKGSRTATATA